MFLIINGYIRIKQLKKTLKYIFMSKIIKNEYA